MAAKTQLLLELLQGQPVIPVVTLERLADAVPLARALARGGLPAIEITLRSNVALDAIRLIGAEVAEAAVGAGTVLTPEQLEQAGEAGARFAVSPGTTLELLAAARGSSLPYLPGAATPSEVMSLLEEGYTIAKFFPAEQAGGASLLRALAAPIPQMRFCPTGGIDAGNAPLYLGLPNVLCVGGSWICPRELIRDGAWERIAELARAAAKLRAPAVS